MATRYKIITCLYRNSIMCEVTLLKNQSIRTRQKLYCLVLNIYSSLSNLYIY